MAWSIGGKTVIITGATSGIGEAGAVELGRLGANLALVGRDRARGEATLAKVKAAGGSAALFLADLSSQAEVRRLAGELKQALPRIDVLVNNAGAVFSERSVTADGFERTFALNHLAYFLLTQLLLDAIKASAPARIVNVSSDAHRMAKMDFADLQSERRYRSFSVYGQSKLANVLFTKELARRLSGTGVTANAMHPGVVATGFGRNNQNLFGTIIGWMAPFMRTPEKAARTLVYLATSPELEAVSGEYFKDSQRATPSGRAREMADAAKLWSVSEELTRAGRAAA